MDKQPDNKPNELSNQPMLDPRMLAAMYGMPEEDEIDLLEYWQLIWGKRKFILSIVFSVAILAAGISLTMPNIYKAEVLVAPASDGSSKGGGLSSALGGLGGLASLAGVSLGGGGSTEQNLAVLQSRQFLWKFIQDEKLMPILFEKKWDAAKKQWKDSDPEKQPSLWDAYRAFKNILNVSTDKKTSLVTIAIEWKDPEQAATWANRLVVRLNDFLRKQAIVRSQENLKYLNQELAHTEVADMRNALFELISQQQKKAMLANTQKEYAFRIIDRAEAPDKKSKPKRSLIVILSAFVAGFLSVIYVFIQEGIRRRKEEMENDPSPEQA